MDAGRHSGADGRVSRDVCSVREQSAERQEKECRDALVGAPAAADGRALSVSCYKSIALCVQPCWLCCSQQQRRDAMPAVSDFGTTSLRDPKM